MFVRGTSTRISRPLNTCLASVWVCRSFPGIFVPDSCYDVIDLRIRGLFFSCRKEAVAVKEALSSDIFALSLVLSAFVVTGDAWTRLNGITWPASTVTVVFPHTALLDLPRQSRRCLFLACDAKTRWNLMNWPAMAEPLSLPASGPRL